MPRPIRNQGIGLAAVLRLADRVVRARSGRLQGIRHALHLGVARALGAQLLYGYAFRPAMRPRRKAGARAAAAAGQWTLAGLAWRVRVMLSMRGGVVPPTSMVKVQGRAVTSLVTVRVCP
jgi:hypothetical protein